VPAAWRHADSPLAGKEEYGKYNAWEIGSSCESGRPVGIPPAVTVCERAKALFGRRRKQQRRTKTKRLRSASLREEKKNKERRREEKGR
jgi:hypothetical protein